MKFGTSALAYQAAIDGMGVVMAQKELVRDDLANGRLVAAYPLALCLEDFCRGNKRLIALLQSLR